MNITSRWTHRNLTFLLAGVTLAWLAAVIVGASGGYFAALFPPLIGAIVALTIIVPTVWILAWRPLRDHFERIGHRPILAFHVWRIPAALMFFWYGAQGELPPAFWILAGTGDLLAGAYALYLLGRPEREQDYRRFHRFGFADFVVAVGTGLTYTLLLDPRMAPITVLPLALIPLFGVGISGASHLVAFDLLRRRVGYSPLSGEARVLPKPATV